MIKIGLLSDTHSYMDSHITQSLTNCDQIWHAGDVGARSTLEPLLKIAPLKVVYGNIDGSDIRQEWPEHDFFVCQGLPILIIHIAGQLPNYTPQVRKLIWQYRPQVIICGHSHILKIAPDAKNNLLYINPGAAGRHGFHQERTLLRFQIENGKMGQMELVKLGKRGTIEANQDEL